MGTSGQDYVKETTGEDQFLNLSVHPFHKWAADALPTLDSGDVFSYDEEGYPLFPDIDLNEMKGKEVQALVQSFLGKIWGECSFEWIVLSCIDWPSRQTVQSHQDPLG